MLHCIIHDCALLGLRRFIVFVLACILTRMISWWRHQMETFFTLLAICVGNSPVSGEFPAQRPVTLSFDVFFDLRLNKRLSKQPWGWWFETPSSPLWRHCNEHRHMQDAVPIWYNNFTISSKMSPIVPRCQKAVTHQWSRCSLIWRVMCFLWFLA